MLGAWLALAVAAACGERPADDPANDGFVRGTAWLGGPIAGAEVIVYQVASDTGLRGGVRGRGVTDAGGGFAIDVGAAVHDLELDVLGGEYVDVASGARVVRGPEPLHGLVFDLGLGEKRAGVAVTPWSHLIHALGEARAPLDGDRAAGFAVARGLLADHLGFDPAGDPIASLDAAAPSATPGLRHALALAGWSEVARLANDDGFADVSAAGLAVALAADAADGLFDGGGALTAACPPGPVADCDRARSACLPTCRITSHALRATLANAIRVYLRGHPATGHSAATLASWLEELRTDDEPRLFPPGPPEPLDARGPRITWLAPADGDAVAGTIAVEARAGDPIGVAALTLAAAAPIADLDGEPARAAGTVDTTGLPEGAFMLRATATDLDGNRALAERAIVVDNLAAGTASGVVVKGPIAGAPVAIHAFAGGVRGALLGSGLTAADGHFTNLAIAAGYSGPLLIEAGGGGSYAEDAAPPGTPDAALDLGDRLRAVVPAYSDGGAIAGVVVSPLTTFAATYGGWLHAQAPAGDALPQHAAALAAVEAWTGVADVAHTAPRAPAQIAGDGAADRYGLVLIGLSQLAYRASSAGGGDAGSFATAMDSMRVVGVLDLDLADGCLDGKAGATPLAYGGTQRPGDQTLRLELAAAIATYLRDPARNRTAIAVADALPLLDALAGAGPAIGAGGCAGGGLFATAGGPFDRTPPAIVWQPPTPAEGAWVRGTIAVRAAAVDDLDGAPVLSWLGGLVDTDGDPGNPVATAAIATTAADDGPLTIAARATDAAGNAGTEPTRTVYVDDTPPVLAVDDAGFFVDGAGDRWTAAPAPILTGTIAEAHLERIALWRGATPIATATVAGGAWTLAVPAGTVPDPAPVALRVEALDRAGNTASVELRLRYDATPPALSTPPTTVRDERGDVVTYSTAPAFPFAFLGRDPTHQHLGPAIALGASIACDATAPTVVKYGYLLDEAPAPYVTEIGGGGPASRNPLGFALAVDDDGVGVDPASVAYRVRDVGTGAIALDWQAPVGASPYAIPLYRRGGAAPSIARLASDGLLALDLRARDRLGRETTITRCWNHRVLPAPILVGPLDSGGRMAQCGTGLTSCAAGVGPAGSGKYALGLLSLADTAPPIDPIGAQVLTANAPGAGLLQYPAWNPTTEPIFLTIALAPPTGASYRRQSVDGRWAVQTAAAAIDCGAYPGGLDTAIPGCGIVAAPTDPVPPITDVTGPSLASFGVRIWEELSPTAFVELAACPGCAAGPDRVTVRLPPRAPPSLTGDPAPPRLFWIVPVVHTIGELRPGGAVWGELAIAGVTITGNLADERYGCSSLVHNLTRYTCTQTIRYTRYRALTGATFTLPGNLVTTPLTSADGQAPTTPAHFEPTKLDRSAVVPTWQTTEQPLPPSP